MVLTGVRRDSVRRHARRNQRVLEKQELTVITKKVTARSEVVGQRRYRPWPRRRESEKMAKFAMYGASQLARVDEENEEKMAVMVVSTAGPRASPIDGERWWSGS